MKNIYFDYAATTPVDKKVLDEMIPYFIEKFGNPSSVHDLGREAAEAVEKAREQVADFLNCNPAEIVFTSGATEGNNWAVKGIVNEAESQKSKAENQKAKTKSHIITLSIEHHCILNSFKAAEKDGVETSYLKVDKGGLVNLEDVEKAIKENTILVSIMYANNEIGTIEPIAEIGKLLKETNLKRKKNNLPKIYFHTDAVQAINYLDCDVNKLGVDLLSLSAHKIYGPKGTGAFYIKQGTKIKPIQYGGGQENNFRSGTHNVPGIVGLGKAISLIPEHRKKTEEIKSLRDYLVESILKNISGSYLNGSKKFRLPHNANISFDGVEGESLLMLLDQEGIFVSTGSACSSSSLELSHVLKAIGVSPGLSHASIRFTLGKETTKEEIDFVLKILPEKIEKLRKISGM